MVMRTLEKWKADLVPDLKDFDNFQAEIKKLKKLCSFINKEKSDIKDQALKNYVIIRLIGVAENLLKSMAADLIDEFDIPPKSIVYGDLVIHTDELAAIKSEHMTIGKIVTSQFNLPNANNIGNLFQKINTIYESINARDKRRKSKTQQHPFFDWIQDLTPKTGKMNLFEQVDQMVKRRNDIAHNVDDSRDSADQLLKKIDLIHGCVVMIWFASFIHLSRDQKKSQKENATKCEQLFGMSLKKFYKIADKHTKN